MLIGRLAIGESQEPDLGGDKRCMSKCDVILNPSHSKILATLLFCSVSFCSKTIVNEISNNSLLWPVVKNKDYTQN